MSQKAKSVNVLTIAGSDSSGGAGIQADLKTFTSLETYGMTVITAVTSQNTKGVTDVVGMRPSMVSNQLETVATDIKISAIKTGMLHNSEIIKAVSDSLSKIYPILLLQPQLVIDPVMVSSSGYDLLEPDGLEALIYKLLPKATVVTPNLQEALILSGRRSKKQEISNIQDMQECCREIAQLGPKNVLLKGGHIATSDNTVTDLLYQYDIDKFSTFTHPRLETPNTHGTGCTLSAALTVYLAKGLPLVQAVEAAIKYVEGAIYHGFSIGSGPGPLNHFHNIVQRELPVKSDQENYPFTSALIAAAGKSWEIYTSSHPFLRGIKCGTLPRKCFQHYLRQDYIFLTHYARIHSLMAFKCDRMDDIEAATAMVKHIVAESKMHVDMCQGWFSSAEVFFQIPETNQTIAYTRYITDIGIQKSLLHLRVALAPCSIGYAEMARKLKNDPETLKDHSNPYWGWILKYADDEFQAAVSTAREILEQSVISDPPSKICLKELQLIFQKVVELESDFWQQGVDTNRV